MFFKYKDVLQLTCVNVSLMFSNAQVKRSKRGFYICDSRFWQQNHLAVRQTGIRSLGSQLHSIIPLMFLFSSLKARCWHKVDKLVVWITRWNKLAEETNWQEFVINLTFPLILELPRFMTPLGGGCKSGIAMAVFNGSITRKIDLASDSQNICTVVGSFLSLVPSEPWKICLKNET